MAKGLKRKHSEAFKAKVALAAMSGEKTLAELVPVALNTSPHDQLLHGYTRMNDINNTALIIHASLLHLRGLKQPVSSPGRSCAPHLSSAEAVSSFSFFIGDRFIPIDPALKHSSKKARQN